MTRAECSRHRTGGIQHIIRIQQILMLQRHRQERFIAPRQTKAVAGAATSPSVSTTIQTTVRFAKFGWLWPARDTGQAIDGSTLETIACATSTWVPHPTPG